MGLQKGMCATAFILSVLFSNKQSDLGHQNAVIDHSSNVQFNLGILSDKGSTFYFIAQTFLCMNM